MKLKAQLEYRGAKHLISRKGQPVTLLRLEDEDGDQIVIWTPREPLGVHKGQAVNVTIDAREIRGAAEVDGLADLG